MHRIGQRRRITRHLVPSQIFVHLVQLGRALHFGFGNDRGFSAPHLVRDGTAQPGERGRFALHHLAVTRHDADVVDKVVQIVKKRGSKAKRVQHRIEEASVAQIAERGNGRARARTRAQVMMVMMRRNGSAR
uniref:Uncharacterized protein n=1 Tax=Cacopsylla melanoneura TaxID=428564 RepID=A0A8D8QMH9_9HEMI